LLSLQEIEGDIVDLGIVGGERVGRRSTSMPSPRARSAILSLSVEQIMRASTPLACPARTT